MKDILLGFLLLIVCASIHVTSMFGISEWLRRRWQRIQGPVGARAFSTLFGAGFGMIILLHLAEIFIWAITYECLGLLNDFRTSFEFSLGTYTTNGTAGIQLPSGWGVLGQLESLAGLLLVGLSTAFLFLVIHKMFDVRRTARETES